MIYYFLKNNTRPLEEYNSFYREMKRNGEILTHDDYPNHHHDIYKYVYYMQLFTKAEIDRCLALSDHISSFYTADIDPADTLYDRYQLTPTARYWTSYERENNTEVWNRNKAYI